MKKRTLVTTKAVFCISILVAILTIIAVWLLNVGCHNSLFENSIISTSILSVSFFLFLTTGLYRGFKLKDDIGKITNGISFKKKSFSKLMDGFNPFGDIVPDADGAAEGCLAILLWILALFVLVVFLWLFGTMLWAMILAFAGMLYWIFFRALRLVFKNGNRCRNNLRQSVLYGLGYTLLYNFWIYGIIMGLHYMVSTN